jgi:hypothetical protein
MANEEFKKNKYSQRRIKYSEDQIFAEGNKYAKRKN